MPRILSQSDIAEFRDRICAVASALFAEVGYGKFNMRDLAKRLGSSAMTPYRYFANKDAILALVKAKGFSMLASRLESVLRDGDRTVTEKSHDFAWCYMAFAREESSFYKLMFENSHRCANDASELDREEQRVRSLFMEYSKMLSNRVRLDINSERMGELLWSALHGVVIFKLTGRMAGHDSEGLVNNAVASIVAGDLWPTIDITDSALRPPASNGSREWSTDPKPLGRSQSPPPLKGTAGFRLAMEEIETAGQRGLGTRANAQS